ncbi:MAG: hypothetical protein V8Q85_01170 [Christensenellales bacterium]
MGERFQFPQKRRCVQCISRHRRSKPLAALSSTNDQLQTLKDITMSKLDTALEAGVSEEGAMGLF